MASVVPNPILSKSKFHNWIKSALAVLITKEEVGPVVNDEILQFQQKCLQDIAQTNSLPPGSICNSCCTENVVVCLKDRSCNANRRKCKDHRNTTQYSKFGCPKKVCHNLKSKIQDAHRFDGPSFKNTDATQWCSNPWEVAKCYMPPDGYEDVKSATDTDFNGTISVIINHKGFESKISDDLRKDNNIFVQGREVGKAIRHSSNLEVEDTDLTKYFTILKTILSDNGFQTINKSPQNASQKLTQLQNDELIIGEDVFRKILEDIEKNIQEQIKSTIKKVTDKQKNELLVNIETKLNEITIQGKISIEQVSEKLKSFKTLAQDLVQDSVEKIRKETENQIQVGKAEIKKETENQIQVGKTEIQKETENHTQGGKEEIRKETKIQIQEGKEEIKKETEGQIQVGKEEIRKETEKQIQVGKEEIQKETEIQIQGRKEEIRKETENQTQVGKEEIRKESKNQIQEGKEELKKETEDQIQIGKEEIRKETESQLQDATERISKERDLALKEIKDTKKSGGKTTSAMTEEINQKQSQAIDQNARRLNEWMIPDPIVEADKERRLFDLTCQRDLQELKLTTEKNKFILNTVRSIGEHDYTYFKELLNSTHQEKLVEFLTKVEYGQVTKEIEKELDEITEERLKATRKQVADDLKGSVSIQISVCDAKLELKGDITQQPINKFFERSILTFYQQYKRTNSPHPNTEFELKLTHLTTKIEQASGAEAFDGKSGSVIIKFRCKTSVEVFKLLQYFDSEDLQRELKELAEFVKRHFKIKEHIYFKFGITRDCLERIMEEIAESNKTVVTTGRSFQKHMQVLDKIGGKLKDFMVPDLIIDADKESKLFEFTEKKDIQEQKSTTEKNELILKKVRDKDKHGYTDFKELLTRTGQEKIVDFLTRTENDLDTIEIEKELCEIAQKKSSMSPHYINLEKVMDKIGWKLKDLISPELSKLFGLTEKRDIQEQKSTTEINELFLKKVRDKDILGYSDFKEFLTRTGQGKIDLLTRTEIGTEKESYEIAEQKSSMNYFKLKKDLKDDLIEFYSQRYSKVQLSPLFEESNTTLASFYIRPEINEKVPQGMERQTTSLSEMFESGNKHIREIYLTADAGLGKTTFSKYLATSWCHAHFPKETDNTALEKNDIDCMSKYEFVFFVMLRDSKNLCLIDNLIFELIVSSLAHSEKFDKEFLQEILNREKCLIILDGLDEWTHPENYEIPCHRTPVSIPHRNDHERCTVLTTTRPWKLGGLNLSSNDLDKQFILTKLTERSARTLTTSTIQRLKSLPDEISSIKDADTLIEKINASKNAELAFMPSLLMYIICLWCDGVLIAKSKCEIYVNIVELLLSRTVTKYGELQMTGDSFDGDIPECFTEDEYCTKYFSLLVSLGHLAYHTLSDEKRENTLVFDESVAEKFLSKRYLMFSCHSGILTENRSRTLTNYISKVSFSHKTVQEFFAAIYISSRIDGQKQVLEECTNIQSILEMSMVCEFLSKMNSKMMCEISAGFMSVINEDEETRNYRNRTDMNDINSEPLYNIQKMFLSCLQEMPESENIRLCLQDFFINEDTIHDEHLQCLSKQNQTNMKSLYINTGNTSNSLYDTLALFSLADLSNLHKLYYDGDWLVEKETEFSWLLFQNLQRITLSSARLTNYEGHLCERLTSLKNVKYLDVSLVTFSHEVLELFFDFISSNKTMKELSLRRLDCKEHGCRDCKINLDLSKNSQLQKLNLERIKLDESSLLLSRDMLNIEYMGLRDLEMSAESLQNMVAVLEEIPQCVTVKMIGCAIEPDIEYKRLRDYIAGNSQRFYVTQDDRSLHGKFEFQTKSKNK